MKNNRNDSRQCIFFLEGKTPKHAPLCELEWAPYKEAS